MTDAREQTAEAHGAPVVRGAPDAPSVGGELVIDLPELERRERAATRREQQAIVRRERRDERLRVVGIACIATGAVLGVIGIVASLLG